MAVTNYVRCASHCKHEAYDKTTVDNLLSNIWNTIYPVGSIYISVNNVDPSTVFGGTWEQIKDKFLLASGNTYNLGATGGSADAIVVSHNHTMSSAGGHSHDLSGVKYGSNYCAGGNRSGVGANSDATTVLHTTTVGGHTHTINANGSSGVGKNMPPYLTVNVWKRTA